MPLKPRELWTRIKEGVIPIVMTPFTDDDRLDEKGLRRQIQWLFELDKTQQLCGVLLTGTNAEFYVLSDQECMDEIRIVLDEVRGRVPVIAGAMAIGTKALVEQSKRIQDLGVDGLQVVNPYYIYPSQRGVLKHLETVCKSIDVGIELYNNPITTHTYVTADTAQRLIESVGDKIVAIKESSPTNHEYVRMILTVGKKIHVIDNNMPFWAHQMWSATLGCRCFMFRPDWAPIAYEFSQAARAMDLAKMAAISERFFPLEDFVVQKSKQEGGWMYIQLSKAGMEHLGVPAGPARLPLMPVSPEDKKELGRVMDRIGLSR
jgi:4-hydroxy-tetrahydrodipicolinate synthase